MMQQIAYWRTEVPLRVRSTWRRRWPWAQIQQLRRERDDYKRWLNEAEEAAK